VVWGFLELKATMRVRIVADARKFLAPLQGCLGMPDEIPGYLLFWH